MVSSERTDRSVRQGFIFTPERLKHIVHVTLRCRFLPYKINAVPLRCAQLFIKAQIRVSEFASTAQQLTLCFDTAAIAQRFFKVQHPHQLLIPRLSKIRQRLRFESLWPHLHDVTHIRPFPVEGRALPTGAIDPTHPIHVRIGRPGHFDEGLRLARLFKRRAFWLQLMMIQGPGAPVSRERRVVPVAKPRLINVNRTTTAAASVVGQGLNALVIEVFVEARVTMIVETGEMMKPHVPPAAIIRVVASENVHQRANGDLQNVSCSRRIRFQSGSIWPHPHHTAAAHLQRASVSSSGLHEPKVTHCDVKPAVNAKAQSIGCVIGRTVLEPERDVLHQDVLFLRHPISIRINELTQMRWMHQIQSVVIPHQPSRTVHLTKHLGLIRPAIVIQIAQANHPPTLGIATERAIPIRRNIQRAIRRCRHKHRVIRRRAIGKQTDLKAFGNLDVFEDCGLLFRR